MSISETRPGFVLKGWHVLVAFLVFFGADVAVNAAFMISAYTTFPGETSTTPYEDGLAYDQALAQSRAQHDLGWRIVAGVTNDGRLQVRSVDRSGARMSRLRVSGLLERPATENGRKAVSFREAEPGVYVADAGPLRGAWDLSVTLVDDQGRKALAERRLVLP
jgi:nitrogen fixation protein FixH